MDRRVLCVDPDADERTATAEALRTAGFDVAVAGTLADARAAVDPDLDCVVTEATLPDGDGLGLLALDSRAHEERAVSTIQQLCDGRIEVRSGDGGREVRVNGLPGQPEGWAPLD